MNWKIEKLGDLCQIEVGKTPSRKKPEYFGVGFTWLSIADMNGSLFIEKSKEQITEKAIADTKIKIVPANTVLYSFKLSIGKINISKIPLYTNEAIAALKIKTPLELDTKFLYYALSQQDFSHLGEKAVKGITLNKEKLNKLTISLPDISTQQRIVTILDEAGTLRKADTELLAKYDELVQASFLQLFGDPIKNQKKWEIVQLKNVLLDLVAGSSFGGEDKMLAEDEMGVLKVSAVTRGYFNCDEFKAVKKELIKNKIIIPQKGDLLFSRANTRELVGATCIVDKDYPYLFLPDKLWRIDLDLNKCNKYYLKFLISYEAFRNTLTKTATGTSGSMLNISMDKLRTLEIPLPPIRLQNHFAQIAQEIEEQKIIAKQQLQQSEALFQSLLQKAFRREL
jgi:type I restriction enzyme, S subunit